MDRSLTFQLNFAHPKGLLGRLAAYRLDTRLRDANRWTVDLLDLQSGDRVLEVGFGSGKTLAYAAQSVTHGALAGIEISRTMLRIAARRTARLIDEGRLSLQLAPMEAIPFPDRTFHKVYAVLVINYLPDPLAGVREIYRVLRPNGQTALFFEAKDRVEAADKSASGTYRLYRPGELAAWMHAAGFTQVHCLQQDLKMHRISYTGHIILGVK